MTPQEYIQQQIVDMINEEKARKQLAASKFKHYTNIGAPKMAAEYQMQIDNIDQKILTLLNQLNNL